LNLGIREFLDWHQNPPLAQFAARFIIRFRRGSGKKLARAELPAEINSSTLGGPLPATVRAVLSLLNGWEIIVKKKIRAIQYGVGPIGASIAKLLREKESVDIVGAIDTDPAKVGRDLGEVVGADDAPWGIKVSGDAKGILDQSADVVMHTTSSSLPKVMDQLLACLDVGSCVVSTCEELSYPYRTHRELAMKLDKLAKDSGVAIVGTGVNPGFVMDKLVITLAAVAQRIEHAKALRIVDAAKRRLPLQKKIGAGMSVGEFRAKVEEGVIKHVGLPESVAMVADSLGLRVDAITETIEPKVATARVQTEFLTVEPGQAAGVHQIARGLSEGKELVYMELQMYVGAKDPADTIELTGHPNISLVIPGGSHGDVATASVAVNSIPAILEAPSGLCSARDLPIGFFPARPLKS
jgi:4-hydroxy-tetrahydrodipicolinate reductase